MELDRFLNDFEEVPRESSRSIKSEPRQSFKSAEPPAGMMLYAKYIKWGNDTLKEEF